MQQAILTESWKRACAARGVPEPPPSADAWTSNHGEHTVMESNVGADHAVRWRFDASGLLAFIVYEREPEGFRPMSHDARRDAVLNELRQMA